MESLARRARGSKMWARGGPAAVLLLWTAGWSGCRVDGLGPTGLPPAGGADGCLEYHADAVEELVCPDGSVADRGR